MGWYVRRCRYRTCSCMGAIYGAARASMAVLPIMVLYCILCLIVADALYMYSCCWCRKFRVHVHMHVSGVTLISRLSIHDVTQTVNMIKFRKRVSETVITLHKICMTSRLHWYCVEDREKQSICARPIVLS